MATLRTADIETCRMAQMCCSSHARTRIRMDVSTFVFCLDTWACMFRRVRASDITGRRAHLQKTIFTHAHRCRNLSSSARLADRLAGWLAADYSRHCAREHIQMRSALVWVCVCVDSESLTPCRPPLSYGCRLLLPLCFLCVRLQSERYWASRRNDGTAGMLSRDGSVGSKKKTRYWIRWIRCIILLISIVLSKSIFDRSFNIWL